MQYGDGCFTTVAVTSGVVEFWSLHKSRLQQGCDRLKIAFDNWPVVEQYINEISSTPDPIVIKVIISRGVGGRGYSTDPNAQSSFFISQHPFPAHYQQWQEDGISLTLSEVKLAQQPLLAGVKHLNRLEQVLVKQDLQLSQFDDAIVCDTQGHIVETSASNIFWYRDHQWYTPNLTECGVDGVMRNLILRYFAQQNLAVNIVKAKIDTIKKAESVFICNSLMKVIPVANFQTNEDYQMVHYTKFDPQHITQWLTEQTLKTRNENR